MYCVSSGIKANDVEKTQSGCRKNASSKGGDYN